MRRAGHAHQIPALPILQWIAEPSLRVNAGANIIKDFK